MGLTLNNRVLRKVYLWIDGDDSALDCLRRYRRKGPFSLADAQAAGLSFYEIIIAVAVDAFGDATKEKRLRLWMADCAARVLWIYERRGSWAAPREAILAARRFARGKAPDASRHGAWATATKLAIVTEEIYDDAAGLAALVAADAAGKLDPGGVLAADTAIGACLVAAETAGESQGEGEGRAQVAFSAAWDAERQWQQEQLEARMSGAEVEDWPMVMPWPVPGLESTGENLGLHEQAPAAFSAHT